ncbi:MAG: ribbon-helix-helix domain-containing protein [Nitrososphaeria archaeon]
MKKSVLITLRISEKQWDSLKRIAEVNQVKVSALIREAINSYIADYTGEPTLTSLNRRIDRLEVRLNELEQKCCNH